jgi:hypothetical protein
MLDLIVLTIMNAWQLMFSCRCYMLVLTTASSCFTKA